METHLQRHESAREKEKGGCGCFLPLIIVAPIIAYLMIEGLPAAMEAFPPVDVLVPMLFMFAMIAGTIIFMRRRSRVRAAAKNADGPITPLTGTKAQLGTTKKAMTAFFGIFFLVGLGVSIPIGLMVWNMIDSYGWDAAECTVTSSHVESHSDSDGTTYSVDIRYTYQRDGQLLTGDRYTFTGGSSSGYQGKADIVAAHPPGAVVPCYVNPSEPAESVLRQGVTWSALILLFPLAFLLVGGIGLMGVFGKLGSISTDKFSKMQKREDWLPGSTSEEASAHSGTSSAMGTHRSTINEVHAALNVPTESPLSYEGKKQTRSQWVRSTIFALIWNSVIGVIIYIFMIKGNGVEGCVMGVIGLFAFIGLLLLIQIPYNFLALSNPRLSLKLERDLSPGRDVVLSWSFEGQTDRIRSLSITLTGEESARYRRGTNTYTDKNDFYKTVIFETTERHSMSHGQTTISLPANTMHSFEGGNNSINWTLSVRGDIAKWPDVSEEWEITVKPEGLAT